MPKQEHDSLVAAVFGRPEEAQAHLRAFLPQELQQILDLGSLRLVPRSFLNENQRKREVDLLFSVGAGSRPGLVYILIEHQSRQHRFMALRLLSYLVNIWEWWRASERGTKTLPIILPIVLYHGTRPWTAPRRITDLLGGDAGLVDRLRPVLPELEYLVTDLASLTDSEILARTSGHSPLAALTVFLLKRGRDDRLAERVGIFAEPLRDMTRRPRGDEELALLVSYLERIREASSLDAVVDAMARAGGDEVAQVKVRYSELMKAEGRAQGRAEGRLLGVSEGEQRALRTSLKTVLSVRFGPLPESVESAIERAEVSRLQAWIEVAARAPDAKTAYSPSDPPVQAPPSN